MRAALVGLLFTFLAAPPAAAQSPGPIPPFVLDVRGLFLSFGEDTRTAGALGIPVAELPKRGLGASAGLHVYLLRRQSFGIGVGAEALYVRGQSLAEAVDPTAAGTQIDRRFSGYSGAVSVNFGHSEGWSYLTAGMGRSRFDTYRAESSPDPARPWDAMFNFGGGARWLMSRHVAFALDLRFYETKPIETTATQPGRLRRRLMVISAGVGIK
jgi:hypothetical protein